jgi:hypothetical protein
MKSQMINLLSSPDTASQPMSATPASPRPLKASMLSQANLSVDDNYVRKQFETWFERWSETAINLYFAERTGIEELQLDLGAARLTSMPWRMLLSRPAVLTTRT